MTSDPQPAQRWRVTLECGHMGEVASPVAPGTYLSCWSVSGAVRGCQSPRKVTSVAVVTAPPPPPRPANTQGRGGEIMPHRAVKGDRIEHKLMPGFVMTVRGVRGCEQDATRPEPHSRYLITDPAGNDDWLCAYDVKPAAQGM